MGVATAIVGSAIIGGIMANNAADKAASAQRASVNDQVALEQWKFEEANRLAGLAAEETRTALTPYLDQLGESAKAIKQAQMQAAYAGQADITKGLDTATAYSDAILFQMQGEFTRWNQIYGPIQDNLSQFYQTLTPEAMIVTGLDTTQKAFQATLKTIQRSFAQRGLDTGAEALLNQQAALATAAERAKLRYEAPFKVAEAQQGFLTATSSIQNPWAQEVLNATGNRQALALQSAQQGVLAANRIADAEANYQNSLAEIAGIDYQANRDIAETKYNVAQKSTSDLVRTQQQAAASRAQITADQASAQAKAISNVLNTGIGMYAISAGQANAAQQANAAAMGTNVWRNPDTGMNFTYGG